MSDIDHAAEIRHKAEVITLTTDSIAERYGLSEYIVGKFREEARGIRDHADALQRQRDDARQRIEMMEWMAYQRRQRPEWSNEEILGRIPYLPEWRELEGVTVQS